MSIDFGMIRIALFASGSGSNVENIANYFRDSKTITVSKVYTNKSTAGVLERCKRLGLESFIFSRDDFYNSSVLIEDVLKTSDAIILAGFLWKIPENLIQSYPDKIINIHPALLPKYGGKGMYGMHVHKAVKENKEPESGITIHFVNKNYDEGAIIFQAKTTILESDSTEDIAQKIHQLEYEHFPRVIEKTLLNG